MASDQAPQTPPPNTSDQGSSSVEPPAQLSLGTRLHQQDRDLGRWLGSNEKAAQQHGWRQIPQGLGVRTDMHDGEWAEQDSVEAVPSMWTTPAHMNEEMEGLARVLHDPNRGEGLQVKHLYRAYKHTPHQPLSVFLKYLVHRVNNLDRYDDPQVAHHLDLDFLSLVQRGKAAQKNGHLAPSDLHDWIKKHPRLPEQLVAERDRQQALIRRGIGLSVRDINGVPYVALTRGLNSPVMANEHPLSSFADLVDTGFGHVMHHTWVPLKDVWHAFDLGHRYSQGNMGPENEFLVSHSAPRFEATPEDVKQNRFKNIRQLYPHHPDDQMEQYSYLVDDATDQELAGFVDREPAHKVVDDNVLNAIIFHKNAGPLTRAALYRKAVRMDSAYASSKMFTREDALASWAREVAPGLAGPHTAGSLWNRASTAGYLLDHPDLTPEDLTHMLQTYWTDPREHVPHGPAGFGTSRYVFRAITQHPSFNQQHAEQMLQQGRPEPLSSPVVDVDMLGRYWDQIRLDPEKAVQAAKNPNLPSAMADDLYRVDRATWAPGRLNVLDDLSSVSPAVVDDVIERLAVEERAARSSAAVNGDPVSYHTGQQTHLERFLQTLGVNPNTSDDVLIKLIGHRKALSHISQRKHMSERLMNALADVARVESVGQHLAERPSLPQSVIDKLVMSDDKLVRRQLWLNGSVSIDQLRAAWPKGVGHDPEVAAKAWTNRNDPIVDLAHAIVEREAYEKGKAARHIIQPFPSNLHKAETDPFFTIQLRDWLREQERPRLYAHPHHYPWHDSHTDHYAHLVEAEQLGKAEEAPAYHDLAQHHGQVRGERPNLVHFDLSDLEPQIDQLIQDHGYQTYISGGRRGEPDLHQRNYNTAWLYIHDPTPDQPDWHEERYARSWRKLHELSHALTLQEVNNRYGSLPRRGRLGDHRTPNEAKRALHWEWLALHKQRQLAEGLGCFVPDETFHRELNTVMHDALHRVMVGRPTEPAAEGFEPHANKIPMEVATALIDHHAQQHGLGEHDLVPRPQDLVGIGSGSVPDQPMIKTHPPFTFPKLGIGDDRRDVKVIDSMSGVRLAGRVVGNKAMVESKHREQLKQGGFVGALQAQMAMDRNANAVTGMLSPGGSAAGLTAQTLNPHSAPIAFTVGPDIRAKQVKAASSVFAHMVARPKLPPSIVPQTPEHLRNTQTAKAVWGTQLHEGLHAMFGRVQVKYGRRARLNLIRNMLAALPHESYRAMEMVTAARVPRNDEAFEEEMMTYLLSYLHNEGERRGYHLASGHGESTQQTTHANMKRAYRHLQAISQIVTPAWLDDRPVWDQPRFDWDRARQAQMRPGRPRRAPRAKQVGANQVPLFEKAEDYGNLLEQKGLEGWEHDLAVTQLGDDAEAMQALRAASWLAPGVPADWERYRLALIIYDGNVERAALHAYHLADTDENIQALQAALKLGEFGKHEATAPTIEVVVPANEWATETAVQVRRAVQSGQLFPLKLSGRHSKGSLAARDPETGQIWLLKPGSGGQSPARGARDIQASQSAREAAFWHCADKVFGLGGQYPRADLLLVDGEEWAALRLLPRSYENLDRINRKHPGRAAEILEPYRESGAIFRWAVVDWVLGNPDSHGQNVMVGDGNVALIDHGSAFAGDGFDPGHDSKSYLPYYLRIFSREKYTALPPDMRLAALPKLTEAKDDELRDWIASIDPVKLEAVLVDFGIDPGPELRRLRQLREEPGRRYQAINKLWAGQAETEQLHKAEDPAGRAPT